MLPYLGTMLSNLKKLRTCFKHSLRQWNIKVIRKSTKRLSSYFCFKNVIHKESHSHIVYGFSCSDCNVTYYDKTECHVNVGSGDNLD